MHPKAHFGDQREDAQGQDAGGGQEEILEGAVEGDEMGRALGIPLHRDEVILSGHQLEKAGEEGFAECHFVSHTGLKSVMTGAVIVKESKHP